MTETWSITPVDPNSFHPDYVDIDGEPSENYHIYKNPNGIHTPVLLQIYVLFCLMILKDQIKKYQ
jgi:hypothetical protein